LLVVACAGVCGAGCIGRDPYLSGPRIHVWVSRQRVTTATFQEGTSYDGRHLEGSALVEAMAGDPEAHATAASAERMRQSGLAMAIGGFALGGAAVLSAGVVAGAYHPANPDQATTVAFGLVTAALISLFGIAVPGAVLHRVSTLEMVHAATIANRHAAEKAASP
jgi:hypothetical protein